MMKTRIYFMLIIAICFLQSYAQTTPYPNNILGGSGNGIVGKINDEFQVTPSGQAYYEIPISVVPGTGAMAPQLSIFYNSALKDGLLGSGFDLSGLSMINRAPANLTTDSYVGCVDFTASDKFMLDGQRLIFWRKIDDLTREYRTEQDNYSKIIATGSDAVNPATFTVYTKSGLIYEYGSNTAQLTRSASGNDGSILFWLLRKVSDTKGNYYTISYGRNDANGEYWPTRMDYTGNESTSPVLVPYASVRFQYSTNSYPSVSYIHGMKVRRSKLLDRIDIYSGNTRVRYYQMAYQAVNNKYQLTSVTEVASDGTKLNPTKFTWHNSTDFTTTKVSTNTSSYINKANLTAGDFNGDGKLDFIATPQNSKSGWDGWRLFLSNGTYFTHAYTGAYGGGEIQEVITGDFNGDGYSDIVLKGYDGNKRMYRADLYLANVNGGQVTFTYSKNFVLNSRNFSVRTMEIAGDGVDDVFLWFHNSKDAAIFWSRYLNNTLIPLAATNHLTLPVNWDRVELGDFNGDGLTDIMNLTSTGYHLLQPNGVSIGFNTTTGTFPNKDHHLYMGDFNGDGKTDILLTGSDKNQNAEGWSNWNIQFSTGTGFERFDFPSKFDSRNKVIYVADINGDGKDDFYAVDKSAGSGLSPVYAYINSGDGTSFQRVNGASTYGLDKWNYYVGDFSGDGKADFLCTANFTSVNWIGCYLYTVPEKVNNLLASITDGLGNVTEISYKPLSNSSVHQRGSTKSYPLCSFGANWYVVDKVTTPNGIGGKNTTTYSYQNALLHKRGRGILGFEYMTAKDVTNNIETKTQMEVDATEYVTGVKSVEVRASGKLISQTTYTNKLVYQPVWDIYTGRGFTFNVVGTTEKKYEYNTGALLSSETATMEYDKYGNITKSVTNNGRSTVTTTNTYTNNESKWFLGRLTKAVVTRHGITRTSTFEYDATSGMLTTEWMEPTDSKLGYKKTYTHDKYGNITQSKTTPNNTSIAPRVQKSTYDAKGRFETQSTNSLNFVTKYAVNQNKGVVDSITDPNNFKTRYTYDSFGQLLLTKTDLGFVQKVNRWSAGHADAPARAVYFTYAESTGNPSETQFFDALGRVLRTVSQGMNGEKIYVDVVYNAKGQVQKTSEPYFPGKTIYWNTQEYDVVGRVTKQTYADNSFYTFQYKGLTTITTNPLGQTDTKVLDAQGNMVSSIDNENGRVDYEYDLHGNCITVTGLRTISRAQYDKYGNKIKLIDPDLGTFDYEYNAYGELVSQKEGSDVVSFIYDNGGRLLKETRKDITITHVYDKDRKGTLSQSSTSNKISKVYTYDSFGRVTSETDNIEGKAFATSIGYNAANKVETITYPKGFKVKNEYTATGYLSKVINPTTKKAYWQANTINARGQLEKFTLGNNKVTTTTYNAQKGHITGIVTPGIQSWTYTFNTIGNLTDRKNNLKNLTEHFDYDALNRLWKVSHNGTLKQETRYDAVGNLTYKTGVGTNFTYQSGTNKLLSVTGGSYNPPRDQVVYSSYKKVTSVKHGTSSLSLLYGVNKERKKSVTIHTGVTKTKYYAGSYYEEELINSETRQINYIFANGEAIAIYEKSNLNGEKYRYLHKDHLGSILAYSNESGGLVQELSYDAWGRRRNPANWAYYSSTAAANAWHPRGFTSHEHIDIFDMVNMNGRMYDPVLGRFLSPDPYTQAPDYTQGLNRYVYCMNNPLSLVDPSGYSWFSKNWKSIVSAAVGIAVSFFTGGSGAVAALIGGALGSASAGLTGALLNGANVGQIAKATFTGGLWGAAGGFLAHASGGGHFLERLFKHSFSQAWLEGVKGGNVKHGFMMGLVSSGGSMAISEYGGKIGTAGRITAVAIFSGTVSELGGGKFANGAMTGAFIMMYNELMHKFRPKYSELEKNYPTYSDGSEMSAKDAYIMAGGQLEEMYNNDPIAYGNACAVRVSIALNDSGVDIPYIERQTFKGGDGKYYFIRSKELNNWMTKEFGPANIITTNPAKLTGHKGVYIMQASYPGKFGAWGHATLFNGTNCIGKCYFEANGGVYRIRLWEFKD